jgi:hypothetical protein
MQLGEVMYPLSNLKQGVEEKIWLDLRHHNKQKGRIYVALRAMGFGSSRGNYLFIVNT